MIKKIMLVVLALVLCLSLVSAADCGRIFSLELGETESYGSSVIEIVDINDNSVVISVDGVTQIFTEGSEKSVNMLDLKVERISQAVTLSIECEGTGIRFAPGDEENTTVWVVGILVLLVFFGLMLYLLMRTPKKKVRKSVKIKAKKKVKKKTAKKKKVKRKK